MFKGKMPVTKDLKLAWYDTNNIHLCTIKDFNNLVTLLKKYPNLLVLSDEVYEFITYEKNHLSIHSYPFLHDRCISVSSFGKTLHITGWKIGYLIAPKHLMNEIVKVHQYLVFCVNSLSQHVLLEFLPSFNAKKIKALYQQKKDLFLSNLKNSRFQRQRRIFYLMN